MRGITRTTFHTIAAGALIALSPSGAVAADMFLKLGDIKGEATAKGHGREIEVQSFHWSATRSSSPSNLNSSKSNREIAVSDPGAPNDPQALAVSDPGASGTKNPKRMVAADLDGDGRPDETKLDKSTPKLAEARLTRPPEHGNLTVKAAAGFCAVGARYASAELTTSAYKYEFRDVIITNCAKAYGGPRPTEEVSFSYASVR